VRQVFAKCVVSKELTLVQTALLTLRDLAALLSRPSAFAAIGAPLSRTLIDALVLRAPLCAVSA
jgi:hypothetical protein